MAAGVDGWRRRRQLLARQQRDAAADGRLRPEGEARHLLTPPPCTGDLPRRALQLNFAPWIEQFAAEGITGGCGSGNYCPLANVRRDADGRVPAEGQVRLELHAPALHGRLRRRRRARPPSPTGSSSSRPRGSGTAAAAANYCPTNNVRAARWRRSWSRRSACHRLEDHPTNGGSIMTHLRIAAAASSRPSRRRAPRTRTRSPPSPTPGPGRCDRRSSTPTRTPARHDRVQHRGERRAHDRARHGLLPASLPRSRSTATRSRAPRPTRARRPGTRHRARDRSDGGAGVDACFQVQASDTTIKGLVDQRLHDERRASSGLERRAVEGNFLGTDPAGTQRLVDSGQEVIAGAVTGRVRRRLRRPPPGTSSPPAASP